MARIKLSYYHPSDVVMRPYDNNHYTTQHTTHTTLGAEEDSSTIYIYIHTHIQVSGDGAAVYTLQDAVASTFVCLFTMYTTKRQPS